MHVYLDYNASAPLRSEASAAWLAAQADAANPNATHYYGQQSRALFDAARQRIAAALGCRGHELVLCGSGTEGNALAVHAALAVGGAARRILCSVIDHSSVLRNAQAHAHTQLIPVDENGHINGDELEAALAQPCALCCLQLANNEIGTLQDIPELVECVRRCQPDALILLDACQGAGKIPLQLRELDVDFASIAGHKFGAPKGCGLCYSKTGIKVDALIHGGRQQQDRRSGTEDVAAMAAMAAALEASLATGSEETARQEQMLSDCFALIHQKLPQARWLARDAKRLSNTMNLVHPGINNAALIPRLDLAGYCVSPGSACMAARGEPSHVIAALALADDLAHSAVRISIGAATTADEMQGFAEAYCREVQALQAMD